AQYGGGMRRRVLADRWGDWILAAALAVGAEYELWARGVTHGRAVQAVLAGCVTLPLARRRRAPEAVLLIVIAALAVASVLAAHSGGVPVEVFLAMLVAFYSVGAHCPERRAPFVGGAALAAIAAIDLGRPGFLNAHGGARPGAWLALAVAWLVGRDLRRRRQAVAVLEDRATRLEREREENARTAVAQERGRIARELHDVVAHSVSVMVV